MFFRILALLPLVSLVTANSLMGRSDVDPVCKAINDMNTTVTTMDKACTDFEQTPTQIMADVRLPIQLGFLPFFLTV